MKRIYLDWAASAPVSSQALRAFSGALTSYGNPSSPHTEGRAAKDILEDARTRIARLAGVKSETVLFTSGATEANALALMGHIRARIERGTAPSDMHALVLPSAHASVRGAFSMLQNAGVVVEKLLLTDGAIDLAHLRAQLRPTTVLVSVDVVCGETGALYKVRDVRRVLDEYTKTNGGTITLHADASQAPFTESFEVSHLGADLVTLDAQKVGGVRGIGVLIAPHRVPLAPLIEGGGQERGLRPGTESAALAAAFCEALEEAVSSREVFTAQATQMRVQLLETLRELTDVEVNEGKVNAPTILNLSLLGRDTDYLVALLDEAGYAVSTRSACETDSEGSRAVVALTGDERRAASTLRVSWGPTTRTQDLEGFAKAVLSAVRFLDANTI